MEIYIYIIEAQTVADAGATARRAIAITCNVLEAANGIYIRALKQRDAEAKSSLEAVSRQMHERAKACTSTDHSVRNFKDGLGSNMSKKIVIFLD